MSPVRIHFWQVAARVKLGSPSPRNSRLNWFMPAGVNRTVLSSARHEHVGGLSDAPLGAEEVKERIAEFVGGHGGGQVSKSGVRIDGARGNRDFAGAALRS